MFAKARSADLTVRELPDELLVYDRRHNKMHCLNRTSALVWRHCDGQTSPEKLAALVRDECHLANADSVVQLALEQLQRRHLLDDQAIPTLSPVERITRRDALRKMAAVAAALPLVMTMVPRANALTLINSQGNCPEGTTKCGSLCCTSEETCENGLCRLNIVQQAQAAVDAAKPPPCFSFGTPCSEDSQCCSGNCEYNVGSHMFVCS